MFEYDRLALDVAVHVAQMRSTTETSPRQIHDLVGRRCSGSQNFEADYNCGSSSGYGSPGSGGTPLASPAPNFFFLPAIQKAIDDGFVDESQQAKEDEFKKNGFESSDNDENEPSSGTQPIPVGNNTSFAPSPSNSLPVAFEDGFSHNEIQQFADLLCSPKKAPPTKYQCHICYQTGHYISDCPMRFNSPYEELTPYQGRKKCYGEFQCQHCKRKWTSQNSVANEAQSCIKCHVPVFPHKQLPVDKAIAMGLIKAQRVTTGKIAPIGHGRPPLNVARQ